MPILQVSQVSSSDFRLGIDEGVISGAEDLVSAVLEKKLVVLELDDTTSEWTWLGAGVSILSGRKWEEVGEISW